MEGFVVSIIGALLLGGAIGFILRGITTKGINQEYETFDCKYCGTTIKIELEEITADCDICGKRNMKSSNQWVRLEEHIDNYTQNKYVQIATQQETIQKESGFGKEAGMFKDMSGWS